MEDDVRGPRISGRHHPSSGGNIGIVGEGRADTRASLDDYVIAEGDELLDGLGSGRNPGLAGLARAVLARNADQHLYSRSS